MVGLLHNNQKGFLLVEVIVATVIISVALVAMIGMFISSTIANRSAADYTVATNLAQQQLEVLKTKPTNYWATTTNIPDISQPVGIPPYTYTIRTTVSACPEDPTNLVEVVVKIIWTDRGASRSLQATTFYNKT